MGGLNWIVKSYRLRFNSVCKFWRSLNQSTLFRDLCTATNTNTNFKFGNFLFHVSGPLLIHVSGPRGYFQVLHESTILMLSPGSESEFESRSVSESSSGFGGWCWSTDTDKSITWSPAGGIAKSITWRPTGKSDAWNTYFALQDIVHKESKSGKYEDDYYYDEQKVFKVLSADDQHQHQHPHEHEVVFKLDNLGIPSCYKFFKDPKYIVGSCNGLICLFDREHMDVSLWNPATRQFKILPKLLTIEIEGEGEGLRLVGRPCLVALGFDVETKDYKVVVVYWSSPRPLFDQCQECVCRVQVYSLSTDSWRLLEDIDSLPGTPVNHHHYHCQVLYHSALYHSVYLNGSCFFIANNHPTKPEIRRFIISFDFTKEIFTTMQFPFPDYNSEHELFLTSLGEKLALFSVFHQFPMVYPMGLMVQDYDIWVLNEHDHSDSVNKESWTKLHSFQTITEGERTIPIGISNDGEFALLELQGRDGLSRKMQLYNLVTKEAKKDFLYCNAVWSKAIVYEPSQVAIMGGKMM